MGKAKKYNIIQYDIAYMDAKKGKLQYTVPVTKERRDMK